MGRTGTATAAAAIGWVSGEERGGVAEAVHRQLLQAQRRSRGQPAQSREKSERRRKRRRRRREGEEGEEEDVGVGVRELRVDVRRGEGDEKTEVRYRDVAVAVDDEPSLTAASAMTHPTAADRWSTDGR